MAELREKDDNTGCLEEGLGFLVKNLRSLLWKITDPGLLTGGVI